VLCSAILSLACSLVQLLEVVTALGDDVTLARETLLGSCNRETFFRRLQPGFQYHSTPSSSM
jgi:hypothetical protein